MVRVKATDPRNGRPSWNRLAEMAGISTTTLTQMVEGRRKTSVPTIEKIAKALRLKPDQVIEWIGSERRVTRYEVPDEVHLLTERQQKALTEMIRAIAADTAGGEHGGDTAATKDPGSGPGNVTPMRTPEAMQEMQPNAARRDED